MEHLLFKRDLLCYTKRLFQKVLVKNDYHKAM